MNKEDIIRMAREAGLFVETSDGWDVWMPDNLERFANLVAAAEREACASICDAEAKEWVEMRGWLDDFANALAKAIRARGKNETTNT